MATITIRIDDELKQSFDDVLNALGISQTEVMINTCKYIVQNKRLPFIVVEQFKTLEELKRELFEKINHASLMVKDLSNSLKNKTPIYPNHRGIIISTLRDFTYYFNLFVESIKGLFTPIEFFNIHDAYINAGHLEITFNGLSHEADSDFLSEKLAPNIISTLGSFERVLKYIILPENTEKKITYK
ncbi:type II toxin-antitoxin system RelB/DinJ family antitoxin [Yersinia ruckeri]|uniref:type II toxin-antitoxin system RelB/DinJ family antitoxin n=1 Tax=Yersinia ruckeri TaxID=29486 RepID=UPI001F2A91A4|nr:type II toxin-antitoxin system RelB/DinJ family antitoxin [Yersinia ruckeri]UIN19232.1 type II toxin-antitoxin system RelB/DinJ family antitoxin [Yersinia ruckeri]